MTGVQIMTCCKISRLVLPIVDSGILSIFLPSVSKYEYLNPFSWNFFPFNSFYSEVFLFFLALFKSMNIRILFHAGEAGIWFSLQRNGRCQCQAFAIDGQTYFTFQLFKQFKNSQGQMRLFWTTVFFLSDTPPKSSLFPLCHHKSEIVQ